VVGKGDCGSPTIKGSLQKKKKSERSHSLWLSFPDGQGIEKRRVSYASPAGNRLADNARWRLERKKVHENARISKKGGKAREKRRMISRT